MGTKPATLGQVLDIVYGLPAEDYSIAGSADFMDAQRLGESRARSQVTRTFGSVAWLVSKGVPAPRVVRAAGIAPDKFPLYEGKSREVIEEDVARIASKIQARGYVAQNHYFVNKTASDLDVIESLPAKFPEKTRDALVAMVNRTYALGAEIVRRAHKRKIRSVSLGEAMAALSYVAAKMRATGKTTIPLSTRELALAVGLSHPTAIKLRRVVFGVLGRRKRPRKGVERLLRKCYADEIAVDTKKILALDKVRSDMISGGWGTLFTRGVFSSRNPMWRSGKKAARLEDRALILATHDDPTLGFTVSDFARKALELGASSAGAYRAAHRCMRTLEDLGVTKENMHHHLSGEMCVDTASPAVIQMMEAGDRWVRKAVDGCRVARNLWRGYSLKKGSWERDDELRVEEGWMAAYIARQYRRNTWNRRGAEYRSKMRLLREGQDAHEEKVFRELMRITGTPFPRKGKRAPASTWGHIMKNRNTTLVHLAQCYVALRDERRLHGDYELRPVHQEVNAALALYTLTYTTRRAHHMRHTSGARRIVKPGSGKSDVVDVCYGALGAKMSRYVERVSRPLGKNRVNPVPPCTEVAVSCDDGRPVLVA